MCMHSNSGTLLNQNVLHFSHCRSTTNLKFYPRRICNLKLSVEYRYVAEFLHLHFSVAIDTDGWASYFLSLLTVFVCLEYRWKSSISMTEE